MYAAFESFISLEVAYFGKYECCLMKHFDQTPLQAGGRWQGGPFHR